MMALSVREKPISRIRSASSSTRTCRFEVSNPSVWSMCCKRRPGVATRMFMRDKRSFSCLTSLPPMTSPAEKVWYGPILRRTSKIWIASSRVGDITRAPRPSDGPHLLRYKISRTGVRKASVLPDPVRAAPSTSLPLSEIGSDFAWMSVMSV